MNEFTSGTASSTAVPAEAAPTLQHHGDVEILHSNSDVDWNSFDPRAYWEHNYRLLRNDDQSIIEVVGEFFSRHFQQVRPVHSLRALDVGSAGNLYPALGMLPWSASITLTEITSANLGWLSAAAAGIGADDQRGRWVWHPFWAEYARYTGYQQVLDPRAELAARHEIRRQDVLRLEPAGWDLGTMFFVAESMTSFEEEFAAAAAAFGRALVPGAPFAAAFMDSSIGYVVADRSFPAVRAVDVPLVRKVLSRFSGDLTVARVDVPAHDPVQDGYEGMIVATGTVGWSGSLHLDAGSGRRPICR
jgi:hypothetical protein